MTKRRKKKEAQATEESSARLSVTIPADDYAGIKKAADRHRVSIAWVVREAVHRYLQKAGSQ